MKVGGGHLGIVEDMGEVGMIVKSRAVEDSREIGMIAKSGVVVHSVEDMRETIKVGDPREIMMENMEEKEADMRDLEGHLVSLSFTLNFLSVSYF